MIQSIAARCLRAQSKAVLLAVALALSVIDSAKHEIRMLGYTAFHWVSDWLVTDPLSRYGSCGLNLLRGPAANFIPQGRCDHEFERS
jgi:hypothetical protein